MEKSLLYCNNNNLAVWYGSLSHEMLTSQRDVQVLYLETDLPAVDPEQSWHLFYVSEVQYAVTEKDKNKNGIFFVIRANNSWKFWLLSYIIFENEVSVSEWNTYILRSRSEFPLTFHPPA